MRAQVKDAEVLDATEVLMLYAEAQAGTSRHRHCFICDKDSSACRVIDDTRDHALSVTVCMRPKLRASASGAQLKMLVQAACLHFANI